MIDKNLIDLCESELSEKFNYLEDVALFNQEKVLNSFKKNKIALRHFSGTTGYGYGDEGREALNNVIRDIFMTESAICSPFIASGTHAIWLCLSGVLRPGDKVLSITGKPYDTLLDCIYGKDNGSLSDFGIQFDFIELKSGQIDRDKITEYISHNSPKMVYLQRSRGYDWRNSLSISDIDSVVKFIKSLNFNGCIMLDNCYGEFVEKKEPTEVGVNLIAGSLIKNIGGGIAPSGGYIAGDKKYIDLINSRLTAPSVAGEIGSYTFGYQHYFQGVFLAPHVTKEALKGSLLIGAVLSKIGYKTSPNAFEIPNDITRAIEFNDKDKLISFIQCVQSNSPIDSFVTLEPWDMPGYEDQVIMAAGCFTQGSSIELSADAPIRPPYIAYVQGGLTYEHVKIMLKNLNI